MATEEGLSNALRNVHLDSSPATGLESNPWQERSPTTPPTNEHRDPDLSLLDADATQGLAASSALESVERPPVTQDVLREFDPLASAEGKAAQQAWANSEGHPPPPPVPTKEPVSPAPPTPSTPNRPSSPIPAFPALAALARTFALPLTRNQRPRSLDSAAAVPSPATLSSFAQQQSTPDARVVEDVASMSNGPVASGSGRSTPSGKDKEQESPQFDFQKFLDQMKMKGAEPVAKYLRSYV
ncbi:hypothetical protein V8D89_014846, partial [Ganoderma adspersum]